MKPFDLHSVDMRVVQNKKKWFMIPLIVLAVAIIMGVIYGTVLNGAVFNVGIDFTGGYTITVTIGTRLDDEGEREYFEKQIVDIIENPSEYSEYSSDLADITDGFVVRDVSAQNEGADRALRVQFTASGYSDLQMVGTGDEGDSDGIVDHLCMAIEGVLRTAEDMYSVSAVSNERTTATVSSELIITAICGVLMSLALMLIYVAVRFELMSGVVALLCLVHDMVMMVLFMCIFHIELTSTFIAALITVLGYSINNTIIIFDMIRDLNKRGRMSSPTEIANVAVRDTLVRSINTTATTFVTVAMIAIMSAIFSVGDLLTFCLPLMAGLIAGMFSSVLLAPTIWALWKTRLNKRAAAKASAANVSAVPADGPAPFRDNALEDFFSGGGQTTVEPGVPEAAPDGVAARDETETEDSAADTQQREAAENNASASAENTDDAELAEDVTSVGKAPDNGKPSDGNE